MGNRGKSIVALFVLVTVLLTSQSGWSQQPQDLSSSFSQAIIFNRTNEVVEYLKRQPDLLNKLLWGGDTPLIAAARWNNSQALELLLTNRADVNARGNSGYTAIMFATRIDMIQPLLAHGADINATATEGDTALARAIESNVGIDAIQFLLENGADVTAGRRLHYAISSRNDTNVAKLLVPYFKNSKNPSAPQFLAHITQEAMRQSRAELVSTIVTACANLETNPLHRAVALGDYDTVRKILGNNPAIVDDKNYFGWTPLHIAVLFRQTSVAKMLLARKANPNVTDYTENTPLHWSAFLGNSNLVELLLQHQANMDVIGGDEYTPLTPLDIAIEQGFNSIARMLITNGADINLTKSPLHVAASKENVELIELLATHGANVNAQIGGNFGMSPLDIAVRGNSPEAVRLLIAHGASLKTRMPTFTPTYYSLTNSTLFHLWVGGSGNTNIAEQLLTAGCDPNATDGDGETPLHVAASNKEAALWLLNHKADLNAKDKKGQTPLHLIVLGGNTNLIQCLLDFKADVNASNNIGKTPLMLVEDKKIEQNNSSHGTWINIKAVEDILLQNGAKGTIVTPPPPSSIF